MSFVTGRQSAEDTPVFRSSSKQDETRIQMPGLRIFREKIHWLPDKKSTRKGQKKSSPEEKIYKGNHKKREKKSDIPQTSTISKRDENSSNHRDSTNLPNNDQPEETFSLSEEWDVTEWDALSIDSVDL